MISEENNAYFNELMAEIVAHAGAGRRFHEDAFFEIVTDELIDLGELDTADRSHHAARGLRVDGYAGDPREDGNLKIILCDFTTDAPPATITKADLAAILKRGRSFVEHALDAEWRSMINGSSPGAQLADLMAESWDSVNSVHIVLITNRPLSDRIKTLDDDAIHERPCTHVVWDLNRLRELSERGTDREPITIDLESEYKTSIPALKVDTHNDLYEGYLAAINGRLLAEIFQQHGARLLEQNVRVFLQAKGGVNKGIRASITDDPDRFFAYNNGITATATEVRFDGEGPAILITSLRNLQIVNGGQTTSSLHATLRNLGGKENLERITVQMKITVLDESDVDVMVPNISKYANSQNKVNAADFHANHPFHRSIEALSRRTIAPTKAGSLQTTKWFYERARGQYADQKNKMTPAKWRAFQAEFPKAQVLTKTDMAKFDMVWRQKPYLVSKGAQKNFSEFMGLVEAEWRRDEASFHEEYFKGLVAKAILFHHLEKVVSDASWYEGGYRANIVAYTLSRVAKAIADAGRVPNFEKVWKQQGPGPIFESVLESVAESVNRSLLAPPKNMKNISEWAKKEECWKAISGLPLSDQRSLEHISVDRTTHLATEKKSKREAKVWKGAEATVEVYERGEAAWKSLESWASGRAVLTPKQLQVIEYAATGKFLTENQAPIALEAWDKCRNAGWNGDG